MVCARGKPSGHGQGRGTAWGVVFETIRPRWIPAPDARAVRSVDPRARFSGAAVQRCEGARCRSDFAGLERKIIMLEGLKNPHPNPLPGQEEDRETGIGYFHARCVGCGTMVRCCEYKGRGHRKYQTFLLGTSKRARSPRLPENSRHHFSALSLTRERVRVPGALQRTPALPKGPVQ
jgi:hypothetical protein